MSPQGSIPTDENEVPKIIISRSGFGHVFAASLRAVGLPVAGELQRALEVTEPIMAAGGYRVYFASDPIDVMVNLRRWNEEIHTPEGRSLWGRRTIKFFVFDPTSRLFAPSKFAAFIPFLPRPAGDRGVFAPGRYEAGWCMSLERYVKIERCDTRFDGHRAKRHLVENLGMVPVHCGVASDIQEALNTWLSEHTSCISTHPLGPNVLVPPSWFQ